jgi:PAS domain S-box-containing protein
LKFCFKKSFCRAAAWLPWSVFAIALLLPLAGQTVTAAPDGDASKDYSILNLTTEEQLWLAAHRRIRLGDDFSWPPFVFRDDKGVYSGISSGYMDWLSKSLDIEINPVFGLTWAEVVDKVKTNEIDILPAVVRSKEREAYLNFTKPYIAFPVVIATHREGTRAASLIDLAGRRVGVVKGYITQEMLAKDFPAINIVTFDSLENGLKALEARQLDAFVDNLGAVIYESRRLRLAQVKIAATTPYKFELCMATRKDWPELAQIIDKSLNAISTRERLAIENTWLAVEVNFGIDVRTILMWALPTVLATTLVFTVILFWNRRLNREIVTRKQAEEKSREASLYARSLIEASLDPLVTISPDGKITDVNHATEAVTGRARQELIGSDFSSYFTEPEKARVGYRQVFTEGRVVDYPLAISHASGHVTDVLYNATVYRDEQGEVKGVFAAARDVTQRKKMEAELQRSNADLQQFAYAASHDMREPLRMISSYIGLLERRLGGALDQDCRDFVAFAKDGAKRLDQMILGLLDYSRIGRNNEPKLMLPLAEALDEAMANLKLLVEGAQASLRVEGELPEVFGDRNELVRLIQNLISNAVKYCAQDRAPVIAVSARRDGSNWLVTIADNGIGFPPDQAERIFGIFQRLHGFNIEGSGIGLANCKKIVEHHGGKIWAEGEPGKGSKFHFTLPIRNDGSTS